MWQSKKLSSFSVWVKDAPTYALGVMQDSGSAAVLQKKPLWQDLLRAVLHLIA